MSPLGFSAPSGPPIPPRTYQQRITGAQPLPNSFHPDPHSPLAPADPVGGPAVSPGPSVNQSGHDPGGSEGDAAMGIGDRNLSFDDEASKYQYWLQKTVKEKREVEMLTDKLSTELAMVGGIDGISGLI